MKKMILFRSASLAFLAQIFVVFMLVCAFTIQAQAQNPKISIQGTLKSANGASVPDGTYAVRFNLYTVESGGTAVWFEDASVEVVGSIYSHYLGSITPLNAQDFAVTLYLGVKVGSYELIPRSELAYSPYAFAVYAAQTVVCSGAVGDIKYSILNPAQFDAANGDCWVPMDGRALAATDKLRIITGLATVPDGSGMFLRSQEFSGGANNDQSRTSATAIATVETQAVQAHSHTISDPGHSHGYDDFRRGTTNVAAAESCCSGVGDDSGSDVGRTSSSAGTGVTVTAAGNGPETRPVNLNFWIYIRIN